MGKPSDNMPMGDKKVSVEWSTLKMHILLKYFTGFGSLHAQNNFCPAHVTEGYLDSERLMKIKLLLD